MACSNNWCFVSQKVPVPELCPLCVDGRLFNSMIPVNIVLPEFDVIWLVDTNATCSQDVVIPYFASMIGYELDAALDVIL